MNKLKWGMLGISLVALAGLLATGLYRERSVEIAPVAFANNPPDDDGGGDDVECSNDHAERTACTGNVVVSITRNDSGGFGTSASTSGVTAGFEVKDCPTSGCEKKVKDPEEIHVVKENLEFPASFSSEEELKAYSGYVDICDHGCTTSISLTSVDVPPCPGDNSTATFAFSKWNFLNGNVLQTVPLHHVNQRRGASRIDLYHSVDTVIPAGAGAIAPGWALSVSEYLLPSEDKGTIFYAKADSRTIAFTKQSDKVYSSTPTGFYTLTVTGDGATMRDRRGNVREFGPFIHHENSTRYARITRIADTNTPALAFDYMGSQLKSIKFEDDEKPLYTLSYNADNKLSSIQDRFGTRIASFLYTMDQELAAVYYGDSRQIDNPHYSFAYDDHGRIIAKTRPNEGTIKYEYNKQGQLVQAVDANGFPTKWSKKGNKVTVVDRNGEKNEFSIYPLYGQFYKAKYAGGKEIRQDINAFGQITEKSGDCGSCDSRAMLTKYTYNDHGQKTRIDFFDKDKLVGSERFEYDDKNNRIAYIDRSGNKTRYEYDSAGNRLATIFADGSRERTEYNARGDVIARIDENGNKTAFEFDKTGNLVKEIYPDGRSKTYRYDELGRKIGEVAPDGMLTAFRYNTMGYMVERVGPVGDRNMDGTVDAADIEIARMAGDFERWTKDTKGNPLAHTDRNGNTTRYEYDGQWDLIKTTYPDGAYAQLWRDGEGRVIKERHRSGTFTFNEYDAQGNVVARIWDDGKVKGEIDRDDSRVINKYSSSGELIATIDRNGNMTSYEYDTFGRRIKTTDPLGHETRTIYKNGNVVAKIDAMGRKTTFAYDDRNRVIRQINPKGLETTFEYDAVGNRTKVVMPNGSITISKYDSMNRLLETIEDVEGEAVITAYVYDDKGRRSQEIRDKGRLNLVTKYEYDDKGRPYKTIMPDGVVQTVVYDNVGNALEKTTAAGDLSQTTINSYDSMNRLAETVAPNGLVNRVLYDEAGLRYITALDPEGANIQTRYDYNLLGKVTKVVSDYNGDDESVQANKYDAQGNLIASRDGTGVITKFAYDADNRRIKTIDALGFATETKYNENGRVTEVVDANGRSKMTQYNTLSQVIKQLNEMDQPVGYTYDNAGNRLTLKDANGNTSVWTYDSLNRPVSLTYPNGDVERYAYDRLGRMVKKTKPDGVEIGFAYDDGGRITTITTPQGELAFTYDALGRKTEEVDHTLPGDEVGRVTFKYDDAGQLVSKTDHNVKQTIMYSYNDLGQKSSMTVGDMKVAYRYNRRGLLSEVQRQDEAKPAVYEYDKAGRRTGLTLPNGVVTDYTYDKAGRLIAVISKNPEGRVVSATEYTLDPTGNRTAMKLTLDGRVQYIKYEFDDAYRLTNESRYEGIDFTGDGTALPAPVYEETFAYDALGNRLGSTRIDKAGLLAQDDEASKAIVKTESTYNDANQITKRVLTFKDGHRETESYTYDANGNTVGIKTTGEDDKLLKTVNMTYDWLNRQTEWKQMTPARGEDEGSTVYEKQVYRGNAWKRIATITHDGETTETVKYLYDGDNVVADFDEKNTLVAQYVTPMLDQNVSMKRGDKTYYYTQDGLGSVRSITDASATIANTNDYTAFGEQVTKNTVNAVKNRYSYTGRERSSLAFANAIAANTSAPMYYRWRMYDDDIGRFGKRDPAKYNGEILGRLYIYVNSAPVLFIDPMGLYMRVYQLSDLGSIDMGISVPTCKCDNEQGVDAVWYMTPVEAVTRNYTIAKEVAFLVTTNLEGNVTSEEYICSVPIDQQNRTKMHEEKHLDNNDIIIERLNDTYVKDQVYKDYETCTDALSDLENFYTNWIDNEYLHMNTDPASPEPSFPDALSTFQYLQEFGECRRQY